MEPLEFKKHIIAALRELPLTEEQVTKATRTLMKSELAPCLKEDSPYFDFKGKVQAVVDRFARDGLTMDHYLQAAVKQPVLFIQLPATIGDHIDHMIRLYRQATGEENLKPLWEFIVSYPSTLSLSTENHEMRLALASQTGERDWRETLRRTRPDTEKMLAQALGPDWRDRIREAGGDPGQGR